MLEYKANQLRKEVITAIYNSGKGHIGGALSSIDILTALFYTRDNWDFTKKNPDRDRFIMSKGHAAIALYAVLSDYGVISKEELYNFNTAGILGEHPDTNMPGIESIAGSLGHGLGIAAGIALSLKRRESKAHVYVLLGDGECYEGSVWEAALFAAHHKLNNLTAIIDRNNLCIHGNTEVINKLDSIASKFVSFGWDGGDIYGHNIKIIYDSLNSENMRNVEAPTILSCHTIKGKGISFLENKQEWHHGSLSAEQYKIAMKELSIIKEAD